MIVKNRLVPPPTLSEAHIVYASLSPSCVSLPQGHLHGVSHQLASPMPLSFFQFPVSFPLSRFLSEFLLSLLVCELYLLKSEIFAKFVIIV